MAVTVIFDPEKPVQGSNRTSQEQREQNAAMQSRAVGLEGNMVRDAGFLIRPAGESAAAAHWRFSGAGAAITYAGVGLGDTVHKEEPFCAKITSAGGVDGLLEQTLIGTAGFSLEWRGRWIAVGAYLKCGTADKLEVGIWDGNTYHSSGFAPVVGGDGFVWKVKVAQLSNLATQVVFRARIVAGTITGYVADPVVLDGAVPPTGPVASRTGRLIFTSPTQVGQLSVGTFVGGWRPAMLIPCIIRRVQLSAGTAPVGADSTVDVNKNGTSMFTSGGRPKIAAGASPPVGGASPDSSTYADRCFAIGDRISIDQDIIGSGGTEGADQTATFEAQCFVAPQDVRLGYSEVG